VSLAGRAVLLVGEAAGEEAGLAGDELDGALVDAAAAAPGVCAAARSYQLLSS
jgi:hypothetical protein